MHIFQIRIPHKNILNWCQDKSKEDGKIYAFYSHLLVQESKMNQKKVQKEANLLIMKI